jgi:hypothetical protein
MKLLLLSFGLLALSISGFAKDSKEGLKDATILVIRHAEKPGKGASLSPAGRERAQAYVNYFKSFTIDSKPLKLDYLFAAADSKESDRALQTIQPLGKALGLKIDDRIDESHYQKLADEIHKKPSGKQYLICWHHGEIPQLVDALGADSKSLIPGGKWPDDVFCWVIQLRYDSKGKVSDARRIDENLMPDDAAKGSSRKR